MWDDVVSDGKADYRFNRQGWISSNFVDNAGGILTIWGLCLLTVPILLLLQIPKKILCHFMGNPEEVYFGKTYAGGYLARWFWDVTVKGFCLVFQHGLCAAIYAFTESVDAGNRSGL